MVSVAAKVVAGPGGEIDARAVKRASFCMGGILVVLAACQTARPSLSPPAGAATTRSPEGATAPETRPTEASSDHSSEEQSEGEKAAQPAIARASELKAPAPSSRQFPPDPFEPPFTQSAQPGDGVWTPLSARLKEPPVMVRTTVHPHEVSRFLTVHVVALDLHALELHYMPGADDVGNKQMPSPLVAGRIPQEHHAGLEAAFNGGFMPQHGRWGMKAAGVVIVPPREIGCTVALVDGDSSGISEKNTSRRSVRIASWPALTQQEDRIPFYRQTPPCLLESGQLHRDLERGNEKPWGGFNPNLVTRRRSAVGIDAQGTILYYAVGIEVGPRLLAEGLRWAGAAHAAELDINDNWTRFALFDGDSASGEPRVASMLLEDMVKQKSGYVVRASPRDFFYVRRAR